VTQKAEADIGNFIEALLTGLQTLADIEAVWSFCESDKAWPERKHKLLYQEVEADLRFFQDTTGFSAKQLMHKWNKVERGPQA
jgi:hypothetical protein